MRKVLSWLGKLRPTGPRKEFSVVWLYNKGAEHCEHKDISQHTALGTAQSSRARLEARRWIIARIIIKDGSERTDWEWKDGKLVYDNVTQIPIAGL